MKGYLYVADEAGEEVEGSRQSLASCVTLDDYWKLRRSLEAAIGENCSVRDSEIDLKLRAE